MGKILDKKIEEFAKEKFSFEPPELIISPSFLEISVRTDMKFVGFFKIGFKDKLRYKNREIRGYLGLNDYRFKFDKIAFVGEEIEIRYEFDTSFLKYGDDYSGKLKIITDCGEIAIPYSVKVDRKYFLIDNVEIKDLYQFTAFSKEHFEMAVDFFFNDKFEEIMLVGKEEERLLRRGLIKNKDRRLALEEFLCHTMNKKPVKISIEKKVYNYHLAGKIIRDRIVIKKDGFGYVNIKVRTVGNFIVIYKNEIIDDDFIGDTYELQVVIDPTLIHSLKTTGRIILSTAYGETEIKINLTNMMIGTERLTGRKKRFSYIKKIIDEYFSYRMGISSSKMAITGMRAALYGLGLLDRDKEIVEYVNIYLNYIAGKTENMREELLNLNFTRNNPLNRIIYIYLLYLISNEAEKERWKKEVESLTNLRGYEMGYFFLIHMDQRYKNNLELRLIYIQELFDGGMHSTFLLMEAFAIYKSAPDYFTKLDNFAIQTINWALKHNYFTGKLIVEKFVILATELREYNEIVLNILKKVYKNWGVEEVVQAICTQLIKKSEFTEDDHEWFRIGVKRAIRLTGLYELYVNTLRDDTDEKIERSVFSYFIYDNTLSARKRAILYSYLVKNRDSGELRDIYREYEENIQSFVIEEVKRGEISDNLVPIYREMFKNKEVYREVLPYIFNISFKKKYITENEKIRGLIIYTWGLKEGVYYSFINGVAFVDVPCRLHIVLVEDIHGNLYPYENFCKVIKLLDMKTDIDASYELGSRNINGLLNAVEESDKYHKEVRYLISILEDLLKSKKITKEYEYFIKDKLLEFYYNDADGIRLERLLLDYDFTTKENKYLNRAAEISLIRNEYPLSLVALRHLGVENVGHKKLIKLVSSFMVDTDEKRKKEDLNLVLTAAYKLVTVKRATNEILIFLRDNLEAGISKLGVLYRELRDKDLLTKEFAERLLEQMLFSEEISIDAESVFSYFEQYENNLLNRAFLAYMAYKWLLKDRRLGEYFENRIAEEAFKGKNKLFKISYLKILSEKSELSEEEANFASISIEELVEDGIVLPFFKSFRGKCRVPIEIENLNFITYNADNDAEISLHYRINSSNSRDSKFRVEWMKNVYQGIFVKEFLIFLNEELQYYISTNGEIIISDVIKLNEDKVFENEAGMSLYSEINMMYVCKELSDEKTLRDYMKNYIVQREIINDIFSGKDCMKE